MPAPSWRMKPARTRSLWLATCASAGASLRVGTKAFESRTGRMVAVLYTSPPVPRASGEPCRRGLLRQATGGDVERLAHDRVLELLRLHPLHDPAVAEEEPHPAVPVRDAHVGGRRLARPVHLAAHHRDGDLALHGREPLLDALGDRDHLDRAASAGRARGERRAAELEAERLEEHPRDADLLHRIGGERDPDRVADPVGEEDAETRRALHRPGDERPRLGDAEVERVLEALREEPVRLHRHRDVVRLERDLDLPVALVLEDADVPLGALHHPRRRRPAVPLDDVLLERARVHADADRHAPLARRLHDLAHALVRADVARVETDALDARGQRGERQAEVEVDVRDERDGRGPHELRQGPRGVGVRNREPDDVRARLGERAHLRERRSDVRRRRRRHGLDRDRGAAADRDPPDPDLAGGPPRPEGRALALAVNAHRAANLAAPERRRQSARTPNAARARDRVVQGPREVEATSSYLPLSSWSTIAVNASSGWAPESERPLMKNAGVPETPTSSPAFLFFSTS